MGTHILWYHSFDVPIWYSVTYAYGADGLRTWKIGLFGDVPFTQYIWSGGNIAMEITGDKIVTYLYGLNRISRKIYGEQYRGVHKEYDDEGEITSQTPIDYYHEVYLYDGHGNVVQIVNENITDYVSEHLGSSDFPVEVDYDGNGIVNITDISKFLKSYPIITSYHYDAFGNHLDEEKAYDTNYFRYCGEYWDKETGEVYLRARYYNPRTGRFATVDPAMDGTNWYVYCKGNPINFVDPWGLDAILINKPVDNEAGNALEVEHMAAFFQDENNDWYFFAWSDKDLVLKNANDCDFSSLSLINDYLLEKGLGNSSNPYRDSVYVKGDFSESIKKAKYLKANDGDGSSYDLVFNNCTQVTMGLFYKGTLPSGYGVFDYALEHGYWINVLPNINMNRMQKIFYNKATNSAGFSQAMRDTINENKGKNTLSSSSTLSDIKKITGLTTI